MASVSPASPLATTLMRNWLRRGLLARLLWPLSLLFRLLSAVRRAAYRLGVFRSTRLPVPVIVVGNIFIGGTGKTPLTIWLVQALRRAGRSPGVVSRGYGSAGAGSQLVTPQARAQNVGDEPLLIAEHGACPVMVGRDRSAAALALLAAHPEVDVIVCDDGMQHYGLQRDLEILLFDQRGVGNGWTLPAGPLREAPGRRRDFTVINSGHHGSRDGNVHRPAPSWLAAGIEPFWMQLQGSLAQRLCDGERRALSSLAAGAAGGAGAAAGPAIVAAAGIGNPERFFSMLGDAGLHFRAMPLPDHYDYANNPFLDCRADFILITEKDAVKCRQIEQLNSDPRLWVVAVTAQIEAALAEQIVEKLRGCKIT
jgi:tetraacyldisaccharide 4'-kinase